MGSSVVDPCVGRRGGLDRDVQHHADDDHRRQERRPGQQKPVVSHVFDVCTSQLRSPRGSVAYPGRVPSDRRIDHITFVQVHTASLAWAPFNAGCEKPVVRCVPHAWTGQRRRSRE